MKQDRLRMLAVRLSVVRTLTLTEAVEYLGVSESTARRLFAQLERSGEAIRTHGGIRCAEHMLTAYSFEQVVKTNIEKKTAIGKRACDFLEDGDVIFCDSGTTIRCFCAELLETVQRKKLNIKLYTNSLANLELLSPHMNVALLGGEYRANRKDFCGYITEQALKGIYFTKSFVSADGCIDGKMFTTTDFDTMRINEVAIQNARQTFMLVDSSKFSVSTHIAYAPTEKIHTVITDEEIRRDVLEKLESSNVRVICTETNKCKEKCV